MLDIEVSNIEALIAEMKVLRGSWDRIWKEAEAVLPIWTSTFKLPEVALHHYSKGNDFMVKQKAHTSPI